METIYVVAAVLGGTILVLQFVLSLVGLSDHDGGGLAHHVDAGSGFDGSNLNIGHDASLHHSHHSIGADAGDSSHWFYEIISIRTLSAGSAFFGLAGGAALAAGFSQVGSFVLAAVAGFGAMYAVYWMYKQVYKLQNSGTENIRNAIGTSAVVYVPIPAKGAGAGKVTFKMQNRSVEYLAVTDDEKRLATGEKVTVVAIAGPDTVRVARTSTATERLVPNSTTA